MQIRTEQQSGGRVELIDMAELLLLLFDLLLKLVLPTSQWLEARWSSYLVLDMICVKGDMSYRCDVLEIRERCQM